LFYSLKTNIPGLEAIEVVERLNAVRRRASVRTTTSRIRRFFTRRNSILSGVATLIVVFGMLFASTPSAQGYSVSNTNQILTTTGGGGLIGPTTCGTGSIIYGIGSGGNSGVTSLTEPLAYCANLNGAATAQNAGTGTIGGSGWGGASNYGLGAQYCSSTQALVGLVAHKQANGYVSGWQLICGTLPGGTSRTTSSTIFGWSNAGTSSPSQRETIECPAGMVAMGMLAYVGSIMDKIGFRCGTITGATQSTVTVTSTTGTFGSTVSLTTSGGNGAGAVTYAVTSAGTAGCSVSGTTLSATAAGTCTVTATKAADTNYNSGASAATTITFVDITPPTMTVSSNPSTLASGASSTITFSSTESTTTFSASDVSATLGTLSNFSGSGTTYTATFTASPTSGGTAVITVASGSFTDSAGNANTSAQTGSVTVTNTTASNGGRSNYLSSGATGTGTNGT